MTEQLITVDLSQLETYRKKHLRLLRGAMAGARRALMNNMAFGVREMAITWGIPRVMTVRNPNIIKTTLKVNKARRDNDTATLGMSGKGAHWTALRAEEFGERMGQQPATKLARGGDLKKKIPNKYRLKGNFITPDDIDVAHEKNEAHRIHVFLERLQRPGGIEGSGGFRKSGGRSRASIWHGSAYQKPFILGNTQGYKAGLKVLGKIMSKHHLSQSIRKRYGLKRKELLNREAIKPYSNTRKVMTVRNFTKKQTYVRKLRWLKPSIDRYLATHNLRVEWQKAVNHARKYQRF